MVTTTYLEMLARPESARQDLPEGALALRCLKPSPAFYRYLYRETGFRWKWFERSTVGDKELGDILCRPGTELWVFYVDGHPAGFSELMRRDGDVQLQYFGLMEPYIGKGLGRRWLDWTVAVAWSGETGGSPCSKGCSRFWVHTCSDDHPNALSTYQRAGFQIYRTETKP